MDPKSSDTAEMITMTANRGRTDKYPHEFAGTSSRLDGLQAAVLRVKFPHLDNWNAGRRQVADRYRKLLSDGSVTLPEVHKETDNGMAWSIPLLRLLRCDPVINMTPMNSG